MSEDFTLYRGESGTPHVVTFRCPHRGLQLSVGWVEGDSIRCRSHGWKYDSSGQCVEVPTEPESTAKTIRIRSYPRSNISDLSLRISAKVSRRRRRGPDDENGKVTWTESSRLSSASRLRAD
jgi:nitrite reductase/ring-hydroxylating ferredoxin subunit